MGTQRSGGREDQSGSEFPDLANKGTGQTNTAWDMFILNKSLAIFLKFKINWVNGIHMASLVYFSPIATTNYHKLVSLKQHEFTISIV